MSFKLKPINKVLELHPESKPGKLIKYSDMPKDVAGYVDMNKTIHLNKNMPKSLENKALKHERVHIKQMENGKLAFDDNDYRFKNKMYKIKDLNMNSKSLPWEKEAYE